MSGARANAGRLNAGAARGPIPGGVLGRILGRVLEPVYAAAIRRRNARFDRGDGVMAVARPVISVGNLSVGGTGKSPMVRWVCEELLRVGIRPAIAMRGYKSGAGESDEAAEYRRLLPGVPLAVGAERFERVSAMLLSEAGRRVGCVVLDDGFQHRRVHRDLDIVLLDATRDPFADRLLPAGWLREPTGSLLRAGAVIVTHTESADAGVVEEMVRKIRGVSPRAVVAKARHETTLELPATTGSPPLTSAPTGPSERARVVVVCGIGNPGPFVAQAEKVADVVRAFVFEDHAAYSGARMGEIAEAAQRERAGAIVTTGKDWSKLERAGAAGWPCPVVVAGLRVVVEEGEGVAALVRSAATGRAGQE